MRLNTLTVGVSIGVALVGPLFFGTGAHDRFDQLSRQWGITGNQLIGLDLTQARQNIFSLARDLSRTITVVDRGTSHTTRFFGVINFIRRGGTWTVADVLQMSNIALTDRQALAADICRPLNTTHQDERIVIKPNPYQYGIASWYGPGFDGRLAASGEIYDMYEMTAAHRTLPLQSVVRVTAVRTGRSIIVRINDRGPYVAGRTIDLSYHAKQALGMQDLAAVYLERIDPDVLHIRCE